MKRIFALFACVVLTLPLFSREYPRVFAHRGCHLRPFVPENSIDGVEMAKRFGYEVCECDVKYTADSVLVIMHDKTINRTMRNRSDYSKIQEPVAVASTTYAELRDKYVLASSDSSMRRPIPLFEDWLKECKRCGITPLLHCGIYEAYEVAQRILGDKWIAFHRNHKLCLKVRKLSPSSLVLYAIGADSRIDPAGLVPKLEAIGGRVGMSSMGYYVLRKEMVDALSARGYETQSSIFKTPYEMAAIHDGASIILSDFCWFQTKGRSPAKKFRKSGPMRLGERVSVNFDRDRFSAMTVRVECKGDFELIVNGKRHYVIHHEGFDVEKLGFRMYDTLPQVELVAKGEGCVVRNLKVDYYKI